MVAVGAEIELVRDAPDLVLLDRRGGLAGSNEAGRLLTELPDDHVPVGQPSRCPVPAVATRARRAGAGDDATAARARDGRWLVLHGTRLSDRPDGDIAVVIEPARPVEMAELILLGHG